MDGVYYNKKENTITFTQEGSVYDTEYYNTEGIQILNGKHKNVLIVRLNIFLHAHSMILFYVYQ